MADTKEMVPEGPLSKATDLRHEAKSLIAEATALDTSDGEGLQKASEMLDAADTAIKRALVIERSHGIGLACEPACEPDEGDPLPLIAGDEPTQAERRAEAIASTPAYRSAFMEYARRGESGMTDQARKTLLNVRTMVAGVDADGGFLAPRVLLDEIHAGVREIDTVSQHMTQIEIGGRGIRWVQDIDPVTFTWAGEIADTPGTDRPLFAEPVLNTCKARMRVRVSNDLLDDEVFGLESFLGAQAAEAKVDAEEAAFVEGAGGTVPRGIQTALDAMGGTPQRTLTATIGTLAADDLVGLPYLLPKSRRRNGHWIIGTVTLRAARLLRDTTGQYLFSVGLERGVPPTLAGYPYTEVDAAALNAPIAANANVAIFGDMKRYWVVRRQGMTVTRLGELFANTDEVAFDFKFRTGGDVQHTAAFRTLRVRAS